MKELEEQELEDWYPIYADYFYVVDGKVYKSDYHGISVRELKRRLKVQHVTNCDIFGRGGFEMCEQESRNFPKDVKSRA